MKTYLIFLTLLFSYSVYSQWNETGNNLTTGKLGVGTNAIGITGTGVNDLVIGDGTSSRGLVINASSNNDGILAFASNSTLAARFIYNNPTGALNYHKPGFGNLLTIDNTGNVGINTISPATPLHITQTDQNGLRFERANHDSYELRLAGSKGLYISNITDGRIEMVFDGNGSVGIGTSSPKEKFHLHNGDFMISSATSANEVIDKGIRFTTDNKSYFASISTYRGSLSKKIGLRFRTMNGTTVPIEAVHIEPDGNVGIGTTNPDPNAKLTVAGNVHSREVKVTVDAGADFVFEEDYDLKPLQEVEHYIKTNKHLSEIPSEKQMLQDGVHLGKMNIKLLQKIEELTLYVIDLQKQITELKQQTKN